jgi:hypothetical protein
VASGISVTSDVLSYAVLATGIKQLQVGMLLVGSAYIAVHGGAGTHDPKYEVEVKRALRL